MPRLLTRCLPKSMFRRATIAPSELRIRRRIRRRRQEEKFAAWFVRILRSLLRATKCPVDTFFLALRAEKVTQRLIRRTHRTCSLCATRPADYDRRFLATSGTSRTRISSISTAVLFPATFTVWFTRPKVPPSADLSWPPPPTLSPPFTTLPRLPP